MTAERAQNIPEELRERRQWVVWRREPRGEKVTKVPYCARTGGPASSTDPKTWATFAKALSASRRFDGVGFVFTAQDPYVGVDLDECRDPETGAVAPWAQEIVDRLHSYTEVTPSGAGVHIICRGALPPGRRKAGQVEMYDSGRFFTMTGDLLTDSGNED